jgi:glucan 1,3-beta-glucosidase
VTDTLKIPAGTQMTSEAWSVVTGKPYLVPTLHDLSNKLLIPHVVVEVGEGSSKGIMEITVIIFSTVGLTPGAIVLECAACAQYSS